MSEFDVFLAPRTVSRRPLAVPIATDDDAARQMVTELIAALGDVALDAGELCHARHLEALAAVVIRRLHRGDPAPSTFAWVDVSAGESPLGG